MTGPTTNSISPAAPGSLAARFRLPLEGLNFLAMPILVVAGTLLALRLQPEPASSAR